MTFFSTLSTHSNNVLTSYPNPTQNETPDTQTPLPKASQSISKAFSTTQKPILNRTASIPTPTSVSVGEATNNWICRGWAQHTLNGLDWVARIAYGAAIINNTPAVNNIVSAAKDALKDAQNDILPQSLRGGAAILNCYKAQKEISAQEAAPATIESIERAIKTTKRQLTKAKDSHSSARQSGGSNSMHRKRFNAEKQRHITKLETHLAELYLVKEKLKKIDNEANKGTLNIVSNASRAGAALLGTLNQSIPFTPLVAEGIQVTSSSLLTAAPTLELPNAIINTVASLQKLETSSNIYTATLKAAEQTGSPELAAIAKLVAAEHSLASRISNVIYNSSGAIGRTATTLLTTTYSLEQLGLIPVAQYTIETISQQVALGGLIAMGTSAIGLLAYKTWEKKAAKSMDTEAGNSGEKAVAWAVKTLKEKGELQKPVKNWLIEAGVEPEVINSIMKGQLDKEASTSYIKAKLGI